MQTNETVQAQDVLLFDGVCNLCNGAVNFIIDHDPKAHFKLAALQSDYGQGQLKAHGYNTEEFDSLVLLSKGDVYIKSTAALKIARKLSGLWPVFSVFLVLPPVLRDWAYNIIAKNR